MLPHFLYQQLHTDANKKMKWWCLCQQKAKVKGHNKGLFLLQLEWNLNSHNYICTIRKINMIAVAKWTIYVFGYIYRLVTYQLEMKKRIISFFGIQVWIIALGVFLRWLFIPKTQDGFFVCYIILSVIYGISS